MSNFRGGYRIFTAVSDAAARSEHAHHYNGTIVDEGEHAEFLPLKTQLAKEALLAPRSHPLLRTSMMTVFNAASRDVCVKNATLYPRRSYHMCPYQFPDRFTPIKLETTYDEVLHIGVQYVNEGEFGHFVEQWLLPVLPYVEWIRANPRVRVSLVGSSKPKTAGLLRYVEALGISLDRLVDVPHAARIVWLPRFNDLAPDQFLYWASRAAAYTQLGVLDTPQRRILCPLADNFQLAKPCRDQHQEQADPDVTALDHSADAIDTRPPPWLYLPRVDFPILLVHRTGRRSIANMLDMQTAIVKRLTELQARPEWSGKRLRLLIHHDAPQQSTEVPVLLRMYTQARVLVGVHGAGMTHKFLMRPRSACIEILTHDPPNYGYTGWVLMATSARAGLEHHSVMTPRNQDKQDAYDVDPRVIADVVETALTNVALDPIAIDESLRF